MAELDFVEMVWFVASMVAVNSLVFVWCGAVELIERFGLFKNAKLHTTVRLRHCMKCVATIIKCK